MTDIADKLLNLRQAALQCSTSMLAGWSHGTDSQYKAAEQDAQALAAALAEVPDPDAIELCVKAVRRFRHSFVYPLRSDGEALDAALAKLEKNQ